MLRLFLWQTNPGYLRLGLGVVANLPVKFNPSAGVIGKKQLFGLNFGQERLKHPSASCKIRQYESTESDPKGNAVPK